MDPTFGAQVAFQNLEVVHVVANGSATLYW